MTATRPRHPRPPDEPAAPDTGLGRFLARAAALTALLTAAGALLGLVRDQTIAHLFGAGSGTDAFLVAWTLPELAATLLIEDAMALLLVPAFSLALARRAAAGPAAAPAADAPPDGAPAAGEPAAGEPGPGAADPVRELVAGTLPRLCLALLAATALLFVAAPALVHALAPGLDDPGLAVDCTRLTALTVLAFGLAGYLSAALRAHRCFAPPAAIYAVYNLAIIAVVILCHAWLGVRAAALGVALGGALMALVQLPFVLRRLPRAARPRRPRERRPRARRRGARQALLGFGLLAPVVVCCLGRQSQVLVERHLASGLPAGAISHLNYAQKVAQMPMVLSLMICTVTFPVVARALADGAQGRAVRRVERDLHLAAAVVLLGSAYVLACAPQIIELLFQRGAFGPADTGATASVMRVYALGLLGHSLAGALVRPFFSTARPTWYPATAMAAGLGVTAVGGALAAEQLGVHGIAAANAAGITLTAGLLLHGLGTRVVPIAVRRTVGGLARLLAAAALAALAGWAVAAACPHPLAAAAAGGAVVLAVFTGAALALRAPEIPQLVAAARHRIGRGRTTPDRTTPDRTTPDRTARGRADDPGERAAAPGTSNHSSRTTSRRRQ
ncbi:virulence factor MviN [Streptomyces sp. WMMC897]|nr:MULTISPECIES: lipid II flippase MurJ [unclassified Streptomyces]MCZ7413451.1 virulence factor MviN [Streptomyces sp. WMMC897]MCZ7430445.1 virulence factor MviN [Streptomyces sp. WMMC1477]